MIRAAIVLAAALAVAVPAMAGNYIFDKPLLPNPSDSARLYIYDPITKTDRNIEWKGLKEALPAGPAGPAGPQGPIGINYRGEWSAGTPYAYRDAVTHNGSTFICLNQEGC